MPPSPPRPAALAGQVFRGSEAIRDRLLTRHQLRGASWVRLMHDVYADARLERDHELLCRAASLRLPPDVMVAGPSAAYLHGVEHAASFTDDVHVLAPVQLRLGSQRRIRVHTLGPRRPLTADASGPQHPGPAQGAAEHFPLRAAPTPSAGGPLTALAQPDTTANPSSALPRSNAVHAAWECAVWLEPVRAVSIIDALLRQDLVDWTGLDVVASANATRPGGRRAVWVFGLADPGRSPHRSHSYGSGSYWPGCPGRSPSIRCGCPMDGSCTLTCPGPNTGWPSSTTDSGTVTPTRSTSIGNGSASWSGPAGGCCT